MVFRRKTNSFPAVSPFSHQLPTAGKDYVTWPKYHVVHSGSPRNVIPKWADALSLTFEPIGLQKTATTQNDRNCVRISNFSVKNQKSLKWVDFSPTYSCPRQKLRPKWPNPKNWAKSYVFMPIPMFLRVGQVIWWHSNRAKVHMGR